MDTDNLNEEARKEIEEGEINPTLRRSALKRTPQKPRHEEKKKTPAENPPEDSKDPVVVLSDSEEAKGENPSGRARINSLPEKKSFGFFEERPAKRKKREGSNLDQEKIQLEELYKETRELVKKTRGISDRLTDLVVKNPNTKVEIKRGVEELEWVSKRLEVRGDRMGVSIHEVLKETDKTRANIHTQTEGQVAGDTKDLNSKDLLARLEKATEQNRRLREDNARLSNQLGRRAQEQEGNATTNKAEQEEEEVSRIREMLDKGGGVKAFLAVAEHKWPQKCFQNTRTEAKDILEISRDWDLATMVPKNFDMQRGENRKLTNRMLARAGLLTWRNRWKYRGGTRAEQ